MTETILLVEDNAQLAEVLSLHLGELGYKVDSAADGRLGLQMALEGSYSLIILDVMLPKINGIEVCKALRERQMHVSILMLTSKSEELDLVVGLEAGADDYLTKPFKVAELVARVKAVLRRAGEYGDRSSSQENRPSITCDDLTIDLELRRVILGGEEIELTAREFDVIAYLASRPGHPFSRSDILNNVWGCNIPAYEHAVNSLIMRLRRKIETDVQKPKYILTVRGVGYKFANESQRLATG